MAKKCIQLDHITKVEGHAKLNIEIENCEVKKVELKIFEGSRFFEGIVKGQKWNELPNITSRICGICSPVHALTSIKAVERAFGIEPSDQTHLLRELILIGGLIQSHVLHLYFLTLPDYLGYNSAIEMAPAHKEEIKRALRIKRVGNHLVELFGGRDIHPIAALIGGFSRIPDKEKIRSLLDELRKCKDDLLKSTELFLGLRYPDFKKACDCFCLSGQKYFYSDHVVNCREGLCFLPEDYEKYFKEYFKEGSASEFAIKKGKESYMVGALARVVNNHEYLCEPCQKLSELILENKGNPYMNVPAQAIEMMEGILRAIDILDNNNFSPEKLPEIKPRAGVGIGANEAPRGILFHKYEFDDEGKCLFANITTPTTQNLQNLEDSIRAYLPFILDKSKDEIKAEIEKLIRAYDPCISCATHFLEMKLKRE